MKFIFTFLFLSLISTLKAQTLALMSFERIYDLNSVENKCDALYKEGFAKESNTKNTSIRLIKKKFIKSQQAFEEEIITISKDTLIYSVSNPKQYIKIKKDVDYWYTKEKSTDTNILIFKRKSKVLSVTESDETRDGNKSIKLFNFALYVFPKD